MNYLTMWTMNVLSRQSHKISKSIYVEGVRDVYTGGRLDKAKVGFLIEPSGEFVVSINVDSPYLSVLQQYNMLDAGIFGLLDILLVGSDYPLTKIKLTLNKIDYDPVASSQMAFRLAGRDAGRKVIDMITRNPLEYIAL